MVDTNQLVVAGIGIICVAGLEAIALYRNMDGAYLAAVVGAICTIIGLCFGVKLTASKSENSASKT